VAEFFDLDVTLVRVVWLLALILGGTGLLAYVVGWIVMPEEPEYVQVPVPNGQQSPTHL
jgi:phage shock protein C